MPEYPQIYDWFRQQQELRDNGRTRIRWRNGQVMPAPQLDPMTPITGSPMLDLGRGQPMQPGLSPLSAAMRQSIQPAAPANEDASSSPSIDFLRLWRGNQQRQPTPSASQVQQNQSPPPMPPNVAAAVGTAMPTPPPSGILPGTEGGVRGPANLPMHRLSGGAFASDAFTLPGNEPAAPTGQSSGTGDPTYDAITRLISNRLMGPQFYGMGGHLFTEPDVGTGLLTRLAEQRSANQAQLEAARITANAHTEAARIQNQGQGQLPPVHRMAAYQGIRDEILKQNQNLANSPQLLDEMINREIDRRAAVTGATGSPAGNQPAGNQFAGAPVGPPSNQATGTPAGPPSPANQPSLTSVLDRLMVASGGTPQAVLANTPEAQAVLTDQNWPHLISALRSRFPDLDAQINRGGIVDPSFMWRGQQETPEQMWLNTLRQRQGTAPAQPLNWGALTRPFGATDWTPLLRRLF